MKNSERFDKQTIKFERIWWKSSNLMKISEQNEKIIMHMTKFGGNWKNLEDVVRRTNQMIWTKMLERRGTHTTTSNNK